jgi:hypothetical protein
MYKTPRIKVKVEKGEIKKNCKMIGIDRVLTESSTGSSLYFDTARGPRSVCTMPVTGKTFGVVWDRISSLMQNGVDWEDKDKDKNRGEGGQEK